MNCSSVDGPIKKNYKWRVTCSIKFSGLELDFHQPPYQDFGHKAEHHVPQQALVSKKQLVALFCKAHP